jgi:hypothetical protein
VLGTLQRLMVCLVAVAIGAAVPVCRLHAQSASIDEVKAAFVFNFTKFVQWPADAFPNATSPFVIGIVGGDAVSDSLQEIIRGKSVNGHQLQLRRVSATDDLAQLHELFISKSDNIRVSDVVARVSARAILTIGDAAGFCDSGGSIQIDVDDSQVRFEVNLDATQRSRLDVSSKLLTLAKVVHSARTPGAR